MRRWQERQQAQQEAEEQVSRQADEVRRMANKAIQSLPNYRTGPARH